MWLMQIESDGTFMQKEKTGNRGRQEQGTHLTIDAFECDSVKLYDQNRVRRFLQELPEAIGMTAISDPFVMNYKHPGNNMDSGVTGFIIIAESHISIHTYPYRGCLFMDVFSCKPFDVKKVLMLVEKIFDSGRIEEQLIRRGIAFG